LHGLVLEAFELIEARSPPDGQPQLVAALGEQPHHGRADEAVAAGDERPRHAARRPLQLAPRAAALAQSRLELALVLNAADGLGDRLQAGGRNLLPAID